MTDKPLKEIDDYLNANGFTTSQGGEWRSNQVSRLIQRYGTEVVVVDEVAVQDKLTT